MSDEGTGALTAGPVVWIPTPKELEDMTLEWLGRCVNGWKSDKDYNGPSILNAAQAAVDNYPELITMLPNMYKEAKVPKDLQAELNLIIANREVLLTLGGTDE